MTAPHAGAVAVLAALLEARTGQQITADRSWRIETALRPLLGAPGPASIDDLAVRLLDGGDAALASRVVDALLNQETSFFRDAGVIEGAAQAVRDLVPARRARIWSAACATGQEPLSLAMLFAEAGGALPEIVATDVSAGAIARARAGSYTQFEVQRGLPIRRLMRWFDGGGDRPWTATPALLGAISYRRQNLVADHPPAGRFDLILCRNVLFYLAPHHRACVLERLAQALSPGGLLLLGAGETVIGQTDALRPSARVRGFYERAAVTERLYTAR
jgi:chemotaxis protein methyltransferase CheR